jgi:hypothetical protein
LTSQQSSPLMLIVNGARNFLLIALKGISSVILLPNRNMKPSIILVWICLLSIAANAGTLAFDDLSHAEYNGSIPYGYGGLKWDYFGFLSPLDYPVNPGGYLNGMLSPTNVAFNAYAEVDGSTTGSIYVLNSVFNLDSAYLTGAWNDGVQINAQGFFKGSLVYNQTYTLNTTAPTLVNFGFNGIDRVNFRSFGGTSHGYGGAGTAVAFDNMVVTLPEPAVPALLICGGSMVYLFNYWRNKRHCQLEN